MADISSRCLRIAVVGFGSSADHAVEALLESGFSGTIDVLDRLCTPSGRRAPARLMATDPATSTSIPPVLTHPAVRFLGNVAFGADLRLDELQRHYDATLFATGTPQTDRLGLPGEHLPESWPAQAFTARRREAGPALAGLPPPVSHAAVTGSGAPVLDLVATLIADAAEGGGSRLTDIYLLTRHGPAHAAFSAAGLGILGRTHGVQMVVSREDLGSDLATLRALENKDSGEVVRLLHGWADRRVTEAPRRVHLLFWCSPTAVLGTDRVTGLRAIRVPPRGACEYRVLTTQSVLIMEDGRSPILPGLPLDTDTRTVSHRAGRIVNRAGTRLPGCYVTGSLKRGELAARDGAGARRQDVGETVHSLLTDLGGGRRSWKPDPAALPRMLRGRDTSYFTTTNWLRLRESRYAHPR